MKNLLVPVIISASMFFIAPSFAAPSSALSNPESRTDSGYTAVSGAGASYAYWHHRHWHRGHHWHRWHHYHRHYYW